MSALTGELVEFLSARLDEDEASAEAVATLSGSPDWHTVERDDGGATLILTASGVELGGEREELAEHHARHDPGRMLLEVEAGRKLIQRYENAVAVRGAPTSFMRGQDDGYRQACLDAISDRAAIYSDHPDYRQEWKP